MLKSRILLGLVLTGLLYAACQKNPPYDGLKQMEIDDAIIVKYLADSNLKDSFKKDQSGLYYWMQRKGTKEGIFADTSTYFANYNVAVLGHPTFEKRTDSTFTFKRPGILAGLNIGLDLMGKPGGKIRMLIPSPLAYKERYLKGGIRDSIRVPPNSILDYTLEIDSVNTKKP